MKGLKILLVDDEVYSMEMVARLLWKMGNPYVISAENGAKAMNVLGDDSLKVDMVISDFNMPVAHGLQLLKAVRTGRNNIGRATPFAMLTGYSDKRLVDTALALDVNAFLIKPVSFDALKKRLSKILSQAKSEHWLKGEEIYNAIGVDGVLSEIDGELMVQRGDRGARGFDLMPKNTPPFNNPDPSGKKDVGVEVRGMPDASGGDGSPELRPQLKGRLCDIGELPENSILARDVYTAHGHLYLHAGTDLTPRIVSILHDLHDLDHPVKEIWIAV